MNENLTQATFIGGVPRRRRNVLWIMGLLLFASLMGLALLLRPAHFHPYVIFKPADEIELTFLLYGKTTRAQCEVTLNRMVEALSKKCTTCNVLQNRCLGTLDSTQRKQLSEEPLDGPSARMSRGVVIYTSPNPVLSQTICAESEKQSALSGQAGQLTCHHAGMPRPFPAEQGQMVGAGETALRYLAQVAAILSVGFAIFLSIRLFSVRHPTDAYDARLATEANLKISNVTKRLIDLLVAMILVVLFFPIFVLVAGLLLILEGPPIFYASRRFISLDRPVLILKFRTMVRDASLPKYRLRERFMRDGYLDVPLSDEVYTPFGRILERTQLVETLQLFNIIFHGMSLVGNRPLPLENIQLLKKFKGWETRFDSPAGITGISQVVGKLNLTPEQRLELECIYSSVYKNETGNILICDLSILWHTIRVLILGKYLSFEDARGLLRRAASDTQPD